MILLLNTSTPVCRLTLVDGETHHEYEWQADRTLALHLLGFLRDKLAEHGKDFKDISGIGVFRGPGSFTGLRIGLTVLNTIADSQQVPIVGATGDTWQQTARGRLAAGENDQLVLPEYGGDAHVTKPRK